MFNTGIFIVLGEIGWPEWPLGNPWPTAAVLLLAFAALRLVGRRYEKKPLVRAAWGALAAALLILGLAQVVETPNRKLDRLTREAVASCVGPNIEAFDRLATPDVKVTVKDGANAIYQGPMVRAALKRVKVSAAKCSGIEVLERKGDAAVVALSITVEGPWGGAQTTSWRVFWRKQGGQWRLVEWRLINMPGGPSMLDQSNIRAL